MKKLPFSQPIKQKSHSGFKVKHVGFNFVSWNHGSHCTSKSISSLLKSQYEIDTPAAAVLQSSDFDSKTEAKNGRFSAVSGLGSPVSELQAAANTTSLPHGLDENETIFLDWKREIGAGEYLENDLRDSRRLCSFPAKFDTPTSFTISNNLWSTIWLMLMKERVCRPLRAQRPRLSKFGKTENKCLRMRNLRQSTTSSSWSKLLNAWSKWLVTFCEKDSNYFMIWLSLLSSHNYDQTTPRLPASFFHFFTKLVVTT